MPGNWFPFCIHRDRSITYRKSTEVVPFTAPVRQRGYVEIYCNNHGIFFATSASGLTRDFTSLEDAKAWLDPGDLLFTVQVSRKTQPIHLHQSPSGLYSVEYGTASMENLDRGAAEAYLGHAILHSIDQRDAGE